MGRTAAIGLATLLALWSPRATAQSHRASFREGILADDKGRWSMVEQHMRQALGHQSRDTGEKVKIYGMRFELYLPHFYLGRALVEQGDCPRAMQAFQALDADQYPFIKDRLTRLRKRCGHLGSPPPPPPPQSASPPRHTPPPRTPPPTRPPPPRRPVTPPVRVTPPPPPPPKPTLPRKVWEEHFEKAVTDTNACLEPAEELTRALEALSTRVRSPFDRDPRLAQRLTEATRAFRAARHRLQQSQQEKDLEAAERSAGQACDGYDLLETLARDAGHRPR